MQEPDAGTEYGCRVRGTDMRRKLLTEEGMLQYERKIIGGITDFIFIKDKLKSADIIFVPGNRFPGMAEEAARLYAKGYAKKVLPSGKFAIGTPGFAGAITKSEIYRGPYRTEWEFLCDVLMKNGVPEKDILREDRAAYTFENAIRSRERTDAGGLAVRTAIICCLATHARRCLMYYQMMFPEAEILIDPVTANGYTAEGWMETDDGIDCVMAELQKCAGQFGMVLKETRADQAKNRAEETEKQ